jgi:hypothetical protein
METTKLFKVTTSPVKADGTFSATFTGLVNYTGGGTITGTWSFGDGKTMKYRNDTPFTHHGYSDNRTYNVRLSITKKYNKNIGQRNYRVERYTQVKTLVIGASGRQSNASLVQSSNK